MLKKVTIGTDAEVFLSYQNEVISAIGLVGGTKSEPIPIGEGCAVQEDNILAEFNIPPVTTKAEFVKYINYCKNYLYTINSEIGLHFSSSEEIKPMLLSNPTAKEFGCEPDCIVDLFEDRDVYSADEHDAFNQERAGNTLRTSGFHIHIGYENPNEETNRELVKLFEKYVTSTLLPEDNDKFSRRIMYGKAGSYRNKAYGVECRSLGGYFLKDDFLIGKVWDLVQVAIRRYNEGERVSPEEFKELKENINNSKIAVKN